MKLKKKISLKNLGEDTDATLATHHDDPPSYLPPPYENLTGNDSIAENDNNAHSKSVSMDYSRSHVNLGSSIV
jgi:hypothetical protein